MCKVNAPPGYAARRRELRRAPVLARLPDARADVRVVPLELRALVLDRRPFERDEVPEDLRCRDELPDADLRPASERRLDVPDADRRLEPLVDRAVRVELRPRAERLVERAVRPSELFFRLSGICFLSSAVSRLTSLLKLLFCPRAV
jgi:hypothetical protein